MIQQITMLKFATQPQRYRLAIMLLTCSLVGSIRAEVSTSSVEDRLTKLEQIFQNQSLSDIMLTVQKLQDELQQMRGKLEVQSHIIDELSHNQQEHGDSAYGTKPQTASPVVIVNPPQQPPLTTSPVDSQESGPLIPPPAATTVTTAVEATPEVSTTDIAEYQEALNQLQTGNYSAAVDGFKSVLAKSPNSKYASNAQYWLGESYYVNRDFDSATVAFNQLLDRYPTSNKVAAATLKLGFINHERGLIAKARELLEQVIQKFPNSSESKLAQKRLELIGK